MPITHPPKITQTGSLKVVETGTQSQPRPLTPSELSAR
jgi:hypothetical protein